VIGSTPGVKKHGSGGINLFNGTLTRKELLPLFMNCYINRANSPNKFVTMKRRGEND